MAITIQDSAASDIDYVRKTFRMNDAVTRRGVLEFEHIGTSAPLDEGNDVFVYDGVSKIWGGTVDEYTQSDITVGSADKIKYEYRCTDFSELASRRVAIGLRTTETSGTAVQALISNYLTGEGVSAGTISDGAYLDYLPWNYIPVEMALDELAEISGFFWNIDKDKALHFCAVDENPAPFDITSSNKPYSSIQFRKSRRSLKTRVYVRAGTEVSTTSSVETFKGDGERRTFVVANEIGGVPTVEVNTGGGYASKTVGINGIDTGKQFYYNIGRNQVTQGSGETALSSSHTLRVTYSPRYPLIISAVDDEAEAARSAIETGSGIYERVVDATDTSDTDEAQLKATSILSQYSAPRLECRYVTFTGGLQAGMTQLINLSAHSVNENFLIESVDASMLDDGTLRYTVVAAANQTVAGWSYWKQKTRQDRKFVIRDNEILNNLRTVKDNMTLSDAEPTYNTYAGAYTVNGADTYINGFHIG